MFVTKKSWRKPKIYSSYLSFVLCLLILALGSTGRKKNNSEQIKIICHNAWVLYMKWRSIVQDKSTRSSSCGWTVLPLRSDCCRSFRLLVPGRQSARRWCRPLRHTWGETGSGHFESSSSYELHQVKTTWTCLSLQENANVFTVRLLQAYRCCGSGTITRHAKHIMTPPMTRMAPPIHPTKRAGPNVYLRRIQRVRRPKLNVEMVLVWHHLGVWAPISPATASPPTTPKPSSVYVTKRKLCTIRLAKADTPAMPHPPDCQKRETMNVALVILRRVF